MVGPKPHDGRDARRTWRGKGFNMIWRPNFGNESGPKDFFLELNFTDEELSFTEITGSGIANRGLVQGTVKFGGAAYVQSIKDSFDHTGQPLSSWPGLSRLRQSPPDVGFLDQRPARLRGWPGQARP